MVMTADIKSGAEALKMLRMRVMLGLMSTVLAAPAVSIVKVVSTHVPRDARSPWLTLGLAAPPGQTYVSGL